MDLHDPTAYGPRFAGTWAASRPAAMLETAGQAIARPNQERRDFEVLIHSNETPGPTLH